MLKKLYGLIVIYNFQALHFWFLVSILGYFVFFFFLNAFLVYYSMEHCWHDRYCCMAMLSVFNFCILLPQSRKGILKANLFAYLNVCQRCFLGCPGVSVSRRSGGSVCDFGQGLVAQMKRWPDRQPGKSGKQIAVTKFSMYLLSRQTGFFGGLASFPS